MEKYPLLKKAPITEALIDIKVKLPDDFSVDQFDVFTERIQADYPTKKEVKKLEGRVDLAKEVAIPMSKQHIGYQYDSEDKKQVVQATMERFTLSRLKPYITWEQLRDEARRIWAFYNDIVSPEAITRVAVRYVNNLNIPMPEEGFQFIDYLKVSPSVPEGIPQKISSFFSRTTVPAPSLNANAIITQALEHVKVDKFLPVILDIDVFRANQDGIEEDIWDILEVLREFKNTIFFNSIQDKLKEEYL